MSTYFVLKNKEIVRAYPKLILFGAAVSEKRRNLRKNGKKAKIKDN